MKKLGEFDMKECKFKIGDVVKSKKRISFR